MAISSLRIVAPVRGYHVYKEFWNPNVSDPITFERQNGTCAIYSTGIATSAPL